MHLRHHRWKDVSILSVTVLLIASSCAVKSGFVSDSTPAKQPSTILTESWRAYVSQFIQRDGRVIDLKGGGISTSEGQAYAMLRALWMGDRQTFDKTYRWALNNLNSGVRNDHLWAWKWGKTPQGHWQTLDKAFASDADQDAALALILAANVWNEPRYLSEARAVLKDLWDLGTKSLAGRRYLLAGDSLCQAQACKLNPSYCAPYAYRIFSQYDKGHNWAELVDSSYYLLDVVSGLTKTNLPADWILLDIRTGAIRLSNEKDSAFSYDAFRVFWRIGLDSRLFREVRAEKYLRRATHWIIQEWQKREKLPAVVSKDGKALANYESPEMLAGVLPALQSLKPEIAAAIEGRLQANFHCGIWYDRQSYYIQNWVWFGMALYQGYVVPFELSRHTSN
ncbi:MAG: glycosyl hydrolase family 8 [Acidobacteria bacterium]|nr:glycosyl hydrolase family 8 [Acidobacteriota bacterium]MCI0621201.1 glycosyl hydrolase family 8 [Acidobacteriota bacterium]MCI0717655.1 glycosyl hydrolase family 8 [Acidobacteriota bacterium]